MFLESESIVYHLLRCLLGQYAHPTGSIAEYIEKYSTTNADYNFIVETIEQLFENKTLNKLAQSMTSYFIHFFI